MSSVGSVQASNGIFTVTNADGSKSKVDLGSLMMMLNLQRTESLDDQIALQLGEIKERNDMISKYTQFMSECRNLKGSEKGDGTKITINGKEQTAAEWAKELGVPWSSAGGKDKEKWDLNINNIRGKVDILNNDSQMANIKLQNLLEKRNNAFDMATQVMKTNNQTIQSTIRNL